MKTIEEYTNYLLNCNSYDDSFDPESNRDHMNTARELFKNYAWEDIYPVWVNHLHTKCPKVEDVINFANLYYYYGASNYMIPNPYELLSYLFYRVDIDKYWEEASDVFDAVSIELLEACREVDLRNNPYYSPFNDKKILEGIEQWKKKEKFSRAD